MNYKLIFTAICLSIITIGYSACGFSSTEVDANLHKSNSSGSKLAYSVAVDFISIDSDFAASAGLSDSVAALQLAGAYRFSKYFSASLGVGLFKLDDQNQFSQFVVDDEGVVTVRKGNFVVVFEPDPEHDDLVIRPPSPSIRADWA